GASQPSDQYPRARPVGRARGDEGDDRDRAEVPDPRAEQRVVDGAGEERVSGAGARRSTAPREEQRDERDTRERPEVERRTAGGGQETGRDRGAQAPQGGARGDRYAQSRQIIRFSSASWCRGRTRKQLLHRNSFSRRGTIFVPASPRSSGSSSSSSSS